LSNYRFFEEMDFLKRRLEFAEREMAHVKLRLETVEQTPFAELTEIDGLPVIVAHLIYQAALEYKVDIATMRDFGEAQGVDLQNARAIAIYRIRELGKHAWPEVARWFSIPVSTARDACVKGKLLEKGQKA
jgi:chromosomal replication initiation ATPase DnaA